MNNSIQFLFDNFIASIINHVFFFFFFKKYVTYIRKLHSEGSQEEVKYVINLNSIEYIKKHRRKQRVKTSLVL